LIRLGEAIDGHSGYEFSWSPYRLLPLSTSAAYHDFHHTHNVGNYSSFFSIWDTVFNSNKAFYEFYAKKDHAEKINKMSKVDFERELEEKLKK